MRRVAKALAATAVGCFAYGVLVEPRDFRVRRAAVPVLPPGSPAIRVLHISDIHLLAGQRAKREFLSHLAGLEPDLVISTGDNAAEPAAIEPLITALGRLLDVPGVFVFGSNDYFAPRLKTPLSYFGETTPEKAFQKVPLPWEELRDRFVQRGWIDLTNLRTTLQLQGLRLDFRGTDDAHLDRDDYGRIAGPVDGSAALTVGVTHAPYLRVLNAMTADGLDLILAGHTHGGQVCVPWYGALITNCDLPTEHAKGLFRHKSRGRIAQVHVSAGLGSSPFAPFRFACPPEVSLLRLVARPE